MTMLYAAKTISVGDHPHLKLLGLTIDSDILMSTALALLIIIWMGWYLRKHVTDGVPGKFQLIWEILVVDIIGDLIQSALGEKGKRFVPLAMTVFVFVLVSNWIGFLPSAMHPGQSGEIFPAPTSDVNLPLALALFVIVWVHIESLRARRFGGYFKHYTKPFFALTPINVIEEITKPITMTFRLFGNIFSGSLMVVVMLSLLPIFVTPPLEIVWKFFDTGLLGTIQAFIFMLLAMLYFGFAMSHDEDQQHASQPETLH